MLEILISYHSKVPIYEQIFKQISNKILSGELPPGSSLPAIRVLAKDLGVSIITVKKAYELLQSQHLINSVVGKGTIVSKLSSDFIEDSIRKQLEKKIDEVIKFGIEVGIDSKEIKEIVSNLKEKALSSIAMNNDLQITLRHKYFEELEAKLLDKSLDF